MEASAAQQSRNLPLSVAGMATALAVLVLIRDVIAWPIARHMRMMHAMRHPGLGGPPMPPMAHPALGGPHPLFGIALLLGSVVLAAAGGAIFALVYNAIARRA
jgi:hypothetical protein